MLSSTVLRRAMLSFMLIAILAACSSTPGPTPRPTASPTVAVTAAPTVALTVTPTSVPTADPTAIPIVPDFALTAEELLAKWKEQGFKCEAPAPSIFAGFTQTVCREDQAGGLVFRVSLWRDGATGDLAGGRASVVEPGGKDLAPAEAMGHLSAFAQALLGGQAEPVIAWLKENLGTDYLEMRISNNVSMATYSAPGDKSQLYLEIDTEAVLNAPEYSPAP